MDDKLLKREQTLLSMLYEKNSIIQALIAENERLRKENDVLKKELENDMADRACN